jgi:hypothetical protein
MQRFADRLQELMVSRRAPDGGHWGVRPLARALSEAGTPISHSHLSHILSVSGGRLTWLNAVGIAKFFGVPLDYFSEESPKAKRTKAAMLLEPDRRLAELVECANALPDEGRDHLLNMARYLATINNPRG